MINPILLHAQAQDSTTGFYPDRPDSLASKLKLQYSACNMIHDTTQ